MILHLLRMRRNVNRNVFNDRKKVKRDSGTMKISSASDIVWGVDVTIHDDAKRLVRTV